MITHAEYHAANPLPMHSGALAIEYATEPRTGAGRVHRISVRADSVPTVISTECYIAALSNTEWRGTAHLAGELFADQDNVKARMMGPVMRALTEVRRGSRGQYEWRLK